jgi:hypothetical protein
MAHSYRIVYSEVFECSTIVDNPQAVLIILRSFDAQWTVEQVKDKCCWLCH